MPVRLGFVGCPVGWSYRLGVVSSPVRFLQQKIVRDARIDGERWRLLLLQIFAVASAITRHIRVEVQRGGGRGRSWSSIHTQTQTIRSKTIYEPPYFGYQKSRHDEGVAS